VLAETHEGNAKVCSNSSDMMFLCV
jgi:hypothetical protein